MRSISIHLLGHLWHPSVFDALTVVLRESAELILILGALAASLRAAHARHLIPWVAAGTIVGCSLGIALSLWLFSAPIDPRWTAGLTFALAVGVLLMVSTMLVGQGAIQSRTQALVAVWLEWPSAPLVLMVFCGIAGFRETLEAGLFLRSLWLRGEGADIAAGAVLGLVGVMFLVAASRQITARIGVLTAFRLSAVVLCLLSIQMMLGALSEFAQASIASGSGTHFWALAAPVLPQGPWYAWICAGLMTASVLCMLRSWWRESAR